MENDKNLAKSTFAIMIFSLLGKILGFFRESLTAMHFGATDEMDAFTASQSATAIISMIITAAIATTFIPTLQKAEKELGPDAKIKFTNNMLWIISLVSIFVVVISIFFAPQISILFTPKSKPHVYDLVVKLIRVGLPVIVFSVMVGVFTGYLQFGGKFAAAGAVPIPLNLVYILYLVIFAKHTGIVGLTIASVLAVLAQLIFLLPFSFKIGYRPKFIFDLKDKYVKEAVILSAPVFVSTAVNDINIIVNRRLAMGMSKGSSSVLYYANKMNLMILGIFIAAITAVIFPTLARAFNNGDFIKGKKVMSTSIKIVLFLTIPATIGMIILARPIVDIAFLHGEFTLQNAIDCTATLKLYSIALISISLSNVLNRVYYSVSDTKTPFYIGLINVIINVSLNLLVAHKFGTRGLAASVSISTTIAVLISFYLLHKKIGNLGIKSYINTTLKTLGASVPMALIALVYFPIEAHFLPLMSSAHMVKMMKFFLILPIVGLAVLIYLLCMYILKVEEFIEAKNMVLKKLKK